MIHPCDSKYIYRVQTVFDEFRNPDEFKLLSLPPDRHNPSCALSINFGDVIVFRVHL